MRGCEGAKVRAGGAASRCLPGPARCQNTLTMSLPRFFAPGAQLPGAPVGLPSDEAHHLRHVLRLAVGAEVEVFDGRGHEWRARVVAAEKRDVQVMLEEARTPIPDSRGDCAVRVGPRRRALASARGRDRAVATCGRLVRQAMPARRRAGCSRRVFARRPVGRLGWPNDRRRCRTARRGARTFAPSHPRTLAPASACTAAPSHPGPCRTGRWVVVVRDRTTD